MVAQCLKKSPAALLPQDTRDSEGRERFHPFAPAQHLNYRIPRNPDWCARGPLPQQLSGSLSLSRDDVLLSERPHTALSQVRAVLDRPQGRLRLLLAAVGLVPLCRRAPDAPDRRAAARVPAIAAPHDARARSRYYP